jgi:glyoxylase-like metal-dependent hydrolase (beta-lactamase superfamily II)
MPDHLSQLTDHLFVYHGTCNVGILRSGTRALLIDCGDGTVRAAFATLGITQVARMLFTHHHRDSSSGVTSVAATTTTIGVPAAEAPWFAAVETFWHDPKMRWHLYNIHPHNLMLATSVPVHEHYRAGDQLHFGDALITVLDTPGHTDGSVTYLVEVDGERIAFCGDTIYGAGQLWDLYSLQKGNETVTDYHGFLGDHQRLLTSLAQILATEPTVLLPTHGVIMREPVHAVTLLRERLAACYDTYVAISALRYYFPAMFAAYAGRPGHMPIREGRAVPDFLRHVGTSWIIIAENREALVMDCGSTAVIETLQAWQADGTISQVTACWVTHYHDDHVDAMPALQAAYPCPTYADVRVAAVVAAPRAWRLPCISPATTRIDRQTQEGERWQWNEFQLTAYHCPGQTYYHGGLLVEGYGLRLFFAGDSFTPAGIDDYCAGNRNLLGAEVGFDQCLALLERLQPTHIFNCHVQPAFSFTATEIRWMRENLAERVRRFGALLPWDDPNYGLDEHWVRCWPYEQDVVAGQTVELRVVFTNHSAIAQPAQCRPILPSAWAQEIPVRQTIIPPKAESFIDFTITIPAVVTGHSAAHQAERVVVPVEVNYAGRALGHFREAILVVQPKYSPNM